MNRLNRKIEYALIALKYMSSKFAGQLTTVKEICAATNIPFDATSRVMQQMAQKNVLKAEHGAQGGYMLITDLSKISFLDIVELINGQVEVVRCVSSLDECEFSTGCNMSSPLKSFNDKLSNFYKSLSIAEIINVKESVKEIEAEAL
ncbi:MAG: Rrf2 family transcriptional regulator [Bdellovibrionales bacterium]|nr:Rrf2 family transcriptional regulator [Bdellovibrionales bacterium]